MLSRRMTAQMAAIITRAEGDTPERVTVITRPYATATAVTQEGTTPCKFGVYDEQIIAAQAVIGDDRLRVLREDRQARIATADVSWEPTLFCELVRSDGTHWRIMAITGGGWQPFWRFRVRKLAEG